MAKVIRMITMAASKSIRSDFIELVGEASEASEAAAFECFAIRIIA